MQQIGNASMLQLDEEITAGRALLELLRQEQQYLINADLDALAQLTEEKSRLLARMGELAMQRQRALAAGGLDDSDAGMRSFLAQAPAAIRADWDMLISIAREGKELNRINGLLLGQHMSRNQAALNALKGGDQAAGTLYGPDGQASTQNGTRRLVVG